MEIPTIVLHERAGLREAYTACAIGLLCTIPRSSTGPSIRLPQASDGLSLSGVHQAP